MPGTVSVVVASFRARPVLEECLAHLLPQCAAAGVEVIVARPPDLGDLEALAAAHPLARVVAAPRGASLPAVRGTGLAAAPGALVALTEDHCIPRAGWIEAIRQHVGGAVDVVGGAMENARDARAVDRGAYFAEYGFFAGAMASEPPLLTGANVAYARRVVGRVAEWSLAGAWENVIHTRLRDDGARLVFDSGMRVAQTLAYGVGAFCGDRYRHGYDFARVRLAEEQARLRQRLTRACTAPLLPPVLAWRIGRRLAGAGSRMAFLTSLPFTLTFLAAWSVGELAGYLRGPAR